MALSVALLAPLLVFAAPKRLELVPPPDGFVAGREDMVAIAALDSAGTLSAATGTPVVTGAAGAPDRLADGLWQVRVVPGAGGVSLSATLAGSASGRLEAKAAPEPTLTLSLNDRELGPGQRGTIIAVVDVRSASGEPVDGLTPVVSASMGVASRAKRIGPGKWSAAIRMSSKRYPHTVLVVASLRRRDATPAAATITLRGRATIPITSEPNAKITVRVGKRSWGPFATDGTGAVDASIEAGPGDSAMDVESLDAAGNRSTRSVPLDMPPYPRLWAAAYAEPNGLDGRTRVTVHAAALDRRGIPGGEAPKATVAGSVIALEGGSGVFTGSALLALPAGKHTVTVSAGTEKETFPVTALAPPAVAVALDVAGSGTLAMGGAPMAITAYRVDAQGRRVAGEAPAISAEGLKLIGLGRSGDVATGKIAPVEGKLLPPAWVSAKANGPGFALSARRAIQVLAGEPASVKVLSVTPPRVPADGESTALLEVRVTDKWGNPVTGASLATSATAGSVDESSTESEPGTYRIIVRAPSVPGAGSIGVVVGLARAETALAFVRPPPKWAIAAGAGGAHNLGGLGTAVGWLEGRRAIGSGEGPWAAVIRGSGSQGGFQVKGPQTGPYDVSVRQALVLGGVRRRFTAPFSGWSLAAVLAAGAGTVEVSEKSAAGTIVGSGTAFGGRAALSAERVMGRGAVVVETGYAHVTTDDALIVGNLGGAELTVGYRHGF